MVNFFHIAEGWSKSLGLYDASDEDKQMSVERMKVCSNCPMASESSFLKFFRGSSHDISAIYCTKCKCPCNEKSLVPRETCPLDKWPPNK